MPRIAPDGLLRPGLTLTLARYRTPQHGRDRSVHLAVRTPPAWADAGQRMSLLVWSGGDHDPAGSLHHPHPRPDRRFRLDLHRHLWDARRTGELRERSGADRPPDTQPGVPAACGGGAAPAGCGRPAADRWAQEAELLLHADGSASGPVLVRLGARRRLILEPADGTTDSARIVAAPPGGGTSALPVLPDAATWTPPDLELLRAGALTADRLHPLVAEALAPGRRTAGPGRAAPPPGDPHLVDCRGARHRIALVGGVLTPLDHDPAEIRREELLAELTGTPLPCVRAIDDAHRRPDCLDALRERLRHGDVAGALDVLEGLLGPRAALRDGPLRDALEATARQRLTYGLFRAGLVGPGPGPRAARPDRAGPGSIPPAFRRSRDSRPHPRHATAR